MAQNRPDKPQITLPDNFGGAQEPFSSSLVESGYEPSIPQIIEGGNLNWMLNGFFQNTKYMRTVLDYVRDTPVGKMFWVNQQGQMDYVEPAIIATDSEFSTGTATDKTPNVKQVVDKFATKADDNAVVKLTGNQTIGGTKTFSAVAYGHSSDATNSLLTTVAKNKSSNGYFQLGNGIIVNWFTGTLTDQQTWTFKKAFSNTNYAIICSPVSAPQQAPSDTNWIAYAKSKANTNAVIRVVDTDGVAVRTGTVNCIAFGY